MRLFMDLIDYSKKIKKLNKGHAYVLIAIDGFDRTLFTVPMKTKQADETLQALKKCSTKW